MYIDAVTIAALADEFSAVLVGGRVQDVVQTGELSFGMEIYVNHKRHYVFLSAESKGARIQQIAHKLRRGVEHPSTIGLMLSKYVEGAWLEAVSQPPWERILVLDFSGPEGDTRLIAEIMDQKSNLILTAENQIMDSAKRIGPADNRYRVIQPGKPYTPPPSQDKLLPINVTDSRLKVIFQQFPEEAAWRVLVNAVTGVSPLLAREVMHRASDDSEAPAFDVSPEIVASTFQQIMGDVMAHRWSPCIAENDEGVIAFAAYPLSITGKVSAVNSISEAIDAYFASPSTSDPYTGSKRAVSSQINGAIKRVQRKLSSLEQQAAGAEQIETLRKQGELILAYASTIKPHQVELKAQYDVDGPEMAIRLDTSLNPVENARRYFARYEKVKRAAADVPTLLKSARQELAYLEQLATELELAENWPEIDVVREELQKAGYWQGQKTRTPQSGKPGIRRIATDDGFVILVGRSADHNHILVTEKSKPNDLWLHARGRTGSHVIIRNDGRPIP
jgi:predicted ribosome quality control (RQC) complex YloA/Tae2 family protein